MNFKHASWMCFCGFSILITNMLCTNPAKEDSIIKDPNKMTVAGTMKHWFRGTNGINAADSIYAVAVIDGEMDGGWDKLPSATIASDGTFKIDIDKTIKKNDGSVVPVDWVLLLINSKAATRFDKVVGFLAIRELDQSMIRFPASKSKKDSISLGSIVTNGNEGVSDPTIKHDTTTFNLTLAQLKEMAQTGRTLKIIKNSYGNFNPVTKKEFDIRPSYNLCNVPMVTAKNKELTPAAYFDTSKILLTIQMFGNDKAIFDYQQIINRQKSIDLYPPRPIYVQEFGRDKIYSTLVKEFISTDTALNPLIIFDSLNNTARVSTLVLEAGEYVTLYYGAFKGISPNGTWKLKENRNTVIAQFDLGIATPFDTITGKPFIYLPSVCVNVNPTDTTVTSVTSKWFRWDFGKATFELVTDLELIQSSISFIQFSIHAKDDMESFGYGKVQGGSSDVSKVTVSPVFTPKKKWVYFASGHKKFVLQLSFGVCGQLFDLRIEDYGR